MHDRPDHGDVDGLVAAGRFVHSTVRQSLGDPFGDVVLHVLGIGIGVLEARSREEPVQVRQMELARHATRLAHAAGRRASIGALAEEQAREPQRQLLLAHPARTLEQQAGRQRVSRERVLEALAERGVAVKGKKGHLAKIRAGLEPEKAAAPEGGG